MATPHFDDVKHAPRSAPNEIHLNPKLTIRNLPSVEAHLQLCDRLSHASRAARASLIANLLHALNRGADAVRYSRDRSHYGKANVRFYEPDFYAFAAMMAAVDGLARSGLIVDRRARPGTGDGRRSTFAATDGFLDFVDRHQAHVRIAIAPTIDPAR